MNQTKFEEDLQNQQFWFENDPEIRNISYLQGQQDILVNTVEIKHDTSDRRYFSRGTELYLVNVLFFPSYLYQKPSYNIVINQENVNLLDCMYTIGINNQNPFWLNISLQQFTHEKKIYAYFQDYYSEVNNWTIQNISTGMLGGKYILLAVQQQNRVDIKIFNLDLTLHFEYQKTCSSKTNQRYENLQNKNLESFDMDYCEPDIIYYLSSEWCFRIDLINKTVIEREFEYEVDVQLLRLLPVTCSEWEYYFKYAKKESLIGYNTEKEDKLILFAILGNVIYQLNMYNLEIIRISTYEGAFQNQSQGSQVYQKISVIPLQLKNRQKKQFSQWSFILMSKNSCFKLFDWKEKNLFQIKTHTKLLGRQYDDSKFSQRFIYDKDNVYILELEDQKMNLYLLQVMKQKGCKNYTYTLQLCNKNEETSSTYFTSIYQIKSFCPPILYRDELTFPSIGLKSSHHTLITNFITFNSFKKQALKQQTVFEESEGMESEEVFNFVTIQSLGYFEFLDEENENYFYFQKEEFIPLNLQVWTLYLFPKELLAPVQSFFQGFYLNFVDNDAHKDKLKQFISKLSLVVCQRRILFFSQKIKDKKINQSFLPMIFTKDNQDDTYLGILDIVNKVMVQKSIHKIQNIQGFQCVYDYSSSQFIILLNKSTNYYYKYIYTLEMMTYQLKFINMNKIYKYNQFSLFIHNGLLNAYSEDSNSLIQFNVNKRFEIENQIDNFIYQYSFFTQIYKFKIARLMRKNEQYYLKIMVFLDRINTNSIELIYNLQTKQTLFVDTNLLQLSQQQIDAYL